MEMEVIVYRMEGGRYPFDHQLEVQKIGHIFGNVE